MGFGLVDIEKCQKFLSAFCCSFKLTLWIYQEVFQPVSYYLSRITTSRNTKLKIFLKFSFFLSFPPILFWFCPQNLWQFEYVPIKCPKIFFILYEFICRIVCEKEFEAEFNVFSWFPGLQNLDVLLEKILWG